MIIKERRILSYEEKISIIKEVQKNKDRLKIANKYGLGESTIRAWERDLKAGTLRKERNIVLMDLFDCDMKTDLIEFCEMIKDEVTDKFKSKIIIPFMMTKGYKEADLINFFEVSSDKYFKFRNKIDDYDENRIV